MQYRNVPKLNQDWLLSDLGSKVSERIVGGFDLIQTWQGRAKQRCQLAALDDRMLRDIGASAADVERETGKWFWQQ